MPLLNSNNNNNLIKKQTSPPHHYGVVERGGTNLQLRLRLRLRLLRRRRTQINIDKKIIPLFNNPIELKQIKLRQKNTYKFNILNPAFHPSSSQGSILCLDKKLKIISLNEILSIFLRGINLYTLTLNNYLKKESKLKLIRELKYDEYNKLNIIYNNYLYLLNRYLPLLRFRSLIYKLELFAPKRLLKYNSLYLLNTNIFLKKKNFFLLNNKKKNIKIIKKKKIINKKTTIIKNFKLNNLFSPINNFIFDIINKKSLLEELKLKKDKKNNYDNLLNLNNKKISLDLSFNQINKNNEIKRRNTRKSILNYSNFNSLEAFGSIGDLGPIKDKSLNNNYSSPVKIMYYNINNKPIINQYLKEISKFNMLRKGIFINYNNLIGFNFNNINKLIKNIYKLLQSSFKSMYCLISKPVFIITPDKIIIQLFYYLFIPNLFKLKQIKLYYKNKKYNYLKLIKNLRYLKKKHRRFKKNIRRRFRRIKKTTKINLIKLSNYNLIKIFPNKFNILCNILSNLFKKPVELNLIRLHYPYLDSNILVNLLGIMINKIRLRILIRKIFKNTIIPSFLSGINIKVAGRLLRQRVVPRKTIKKIIRGTSNRNKINFLDVARYSNKNRRGAFTITVKSGQNFFK